MSITDIRTRVVTVLAPEATLGFADQNGAGPDSIRVDQIAPHGWRVIDRRLPRGDPFRVLAFIEFREAWYEVTQRGSVPEWHAFATLEGGVAHVTATATALAQARLRAGDWSSLRPPLRERRANLVAVPRLPADADRPEGDPQPDPQPPEPPVDNPSG